MGLPPMDSSENSPLRKILNHVIAGVLTLLVGGIIVATYHMFHLDRMIEQLELKTYDLRAQINWGQGGKRPSEDVVILQFDDPSLNALSDEFGVWPWPRDVHARMITYLNEEAKAKMLLYDIMFVSYRKGSETEDKLLADAFHKYDNVYLSMNFDNELEQSMRLGKDLTPRDIEMIEPLAIPVKFHPDFGKTSASSHLALAPTPDGGIFFDNNHMIFNHFRSIMPSLLNKGSNIGMINHGADSDGVSRGNPLFFRFEYQKFIKTDALPVFQDGEFWYDKRGRRTDADGYLYQKTQYDIHQKDGQWYDKNPNYPRLVDERGYLMNNFGQYIYQREEKLTAGYFPYLGLRAVLDLRFPRKVPEMYVSPDGRLQFQNYDIPLSRNGDFLVNWYNVNLSREMMQKNLEGIKRYREHQLPMEIKNLEEELARHAGNPAELEKVKQVLAVKHDEMTKSLQAIAFLEERLSQDLEPQPYDMISAWQVIGLMKKEEKGLPLDKQDQELKERLRNKVIFVGATAVAAYDIKNTSIHPTMPGVVLQANLFDNIYQNDGHFMQRVHPHANTVICILLCLLAAGSTFKMRSAIAGMLTTANLAVLYILVGILLYHYQNLWINIAMPLVALVITTMMTFMVKYVIRDKDYEKTYALATTDSMTGLYNHRYFQEHMRLSIEQANRFKHKFSLVLIDIDFFKKFNDTYGHQAGDEVLRCVAKKLKKTVRNVDVVARYGGEEMAVILDRANEEEALAVANKLVKAIAEEAYPIAEGVAKHVTISCGVSTYPTHGKTPTEMIEFSDQGLYRAKEGGRNQVGAQYDTEESIAAREQAHENLQKYGHSAGDLNAQGANPHGGDQAPPPNAQPGEQPPAA